MIDFIPLEYYYQVYLYLSLFIVLLTFFHARILHIDDRKNISYITFFGYLILISLTLYIGLRPVSGKYFTDMDTYARIYRSYLNGGEIVLKTDVVFQIFMKTCSYFLSTHSFFLLCAIIYIYPLYIVSKRFFSTYWFYAFFMFVISFQFWTYGVNGIRNGMAGSIFLLAISFHNKKPVMIALLVLSSLFHETMKLPIGAFILTLLVKNPKPYLIGWLLAIPLSIALGGFWENLFASLGFGGDRLGGYLSGDKDELITNTGFRYDFLLYSAVAVFTGWYFIFKRNFKDPIYMQIFNIYVTANAFWVLIIRANFSNRFAYLSWFMMGLVIIYPFIKMKFYKNPHLAIGYVLAGYFMFTFAMFIYYNY